MQLNLLGASQCPMPIQVVGVAQRFHVISLSANSISKGGGHLLRVRGAVKHSQQSIAARHVLTRAVASTERASSNPLTAQETNPSSASPSTPSSSSTTSLWPCRGGQVVRVIQDYSDKEASHTVKIIIERLRHDQEAELMWGVYRSSPHAWQHPQRIVPPESHVDQSSGAMKSKMEALSSTSRAITISIPASMSPLTFAFVVALGPPSSPGGGAPMPKPSKRDAFATPLTGRHFSVLLGIQPGRASPLGPSLITASAGPAASKQTDGRKKGGKNSPFTAVNFAVRCRGGTTMSLCILQSPTRHPHREAKESSNKVEHGEGEWTCVEFALDPTLNRTGNTWHVAVPAGIITDLRTLRYGWRVEGDVSWESGFRVQPDRLLLDPMAPAVALIPPEGAPTNVPLPEVQNTRLSTGKENGEGEACCYVAASALGGDFAETQDSGSGGGEEGLQEGFRYIADPLRRPVEGMCALEINISTFAHDHHVAHPGTFLGVAERVDHIKALGVNTVILWPCYATTTGKNGPGSKPHHAAAAAAALSLLAPDPTLSSDPFDPGLAASELRDMVRTLHAAGIEVIASIDPTFTADGVDVHPTTVSLRGLDHAAYFRPNGVLNCGHPAVAELLTTALRRWTLDFGFDGFCFMNAENLVQDAEGLVLDAPAIADALCHDPILARVKLIAAPSEDTLLPRGGARGFPHWGLWQQRNAAFRRDMTAFMAECTHGMLDVVAMRLTGSADIFEAAWEEGLPGNLAAARRPAFSYNAVSAPFGVYPLMDLAREVAHGAAAAAAATSGGALVHSAAEIEWTAKTLTKSMLLASILGQGVPVVSAADVSDDLEMARFVGVLMRLRKKTAPLLQPPLFDSPRDITWLGASGQEPDWAGEGGATTNYLALCVRRPVGRQAPEVPGTSTPGVTQNGTTQKNASGGTLGVYIGFNPYPESVSVTLPPLEYGQNWFQAVDTRCMAPDDAKTLHPTMEGLNPVIGDGATPFSVGGKAAVVLVTGDFSFRSSS